MAKITFGTGTFHMHELQFHWGVVQQWNQPPNTDARRSALATDSFQC